MQVKGATLVVLQLLRELGVELVSDGGLVDGSPVAVEGVVVVQRPHHPLRPRLHCDTKSPLRKTLKSGPTREERQTELARLADYDVYRISLALTCHHRLRRIQNKASRHLK